VSVVCYLGPVMTGPIDLWVSTIAITHEAGGLSLLAVTLLMTSSNPVAGKWLGAKRHDEAEALSNIVVMPQKQMNNTLCSVPGFPARSSALFFHTLKRGLFSSVNFWSGSLGAARSLVSSYW